MPGKDRTGPGSLGPMTGKKMGHCNGNSHWEHGPGTGFKTGTGRARGNRHCYYTTGIPGRYFQKAMGLSESEQEGMLKLELEELEKRISLIQAQMQNLRKDQDES